jgi:hypothetical protein
MGDDLYSASSAFVETASPLFPATTTSIMCHRWQKAMLADIRMWRPWKFGLKIPFDIDTQRMGSSSPPAADTTVKEPSEGDLGAGEEV